MDNGKLHVGCVCIYTHVYKAYVRSLHGISFISVIVLDSTLRGIRREILNSPFTVQGLGF